MSIGQVRVGATGLSVSTLVLGTVSWGGYFGQVDVATLEPVIDVCDELGITTLDTAPRYGNGHAESRIGAVLADRRRDRYTLITKVGWDLTADAPVPAFDEDSIRRGLAASAGRMGVDSVDIALLHDPEGQGDQWRHEAWRALRRMKDDGQVNAIGVGTADLSAADAALDLPGIDVLLMAGGCSALDTSAFINVLPRARQCGVTVLAGAVLGSGILADPHRPGVMYRHRPALAAETQRVATMARISDRYGVHVRTAAVSLIARSPLVDAVVVGTASAERIRQIASDLDAPVPEELFEEWEHVGARA